ncbi:MAG: hypothetical protein ABSC07_18645 [Terriglobales bacterium]
MTKTRMVVFAGLAAIVTFSVCGQAEAQSAARTSGKFRLVAVQKTSGDRVSPDTFKLPGLEAGPLLMSETAPLDGSGNSYWPCYTGDSNYPDCTSLPAGGWVGGIPYQTWSLSSCSSGPCADIYSWFTGNTTDSTDDLVFTLTAKQGANFILDTGPIDLGPAPSFGNGFVYAINFMQFGPGSCAVETCVTPVAGKVTLTSVSTIGKKNKATSTETIYLQ